MEDEYKELYGETRKDQKKERKQKQAQDRSKYKKSASQKEKMAPENAERGRVVAISPEGVLVDINHEKRLCLLRGSLKKERTATKNLVIIGDFVFVEQNSIVHVEKRTSILARADNLHRRKQQLIAANIDQVFICVSLLTPKLKPTLVDRYIIATKSGNMEPIILLNKVDVLTDPPEHIPLNEVEAEARLKEEFIKSYPNVVEVSTKTGVGIDKILHQMEGKSSVFAGQSGVGKSSIINALFNLDLPTGDVVEKTRKGSHTTTTAHLINTPGDGFCIDTPGIKSFGLWDIDPASVEQYFPEIQKLAKGCKFPNCTHIHEPDCVVLGALKEGAISSLRYESYKNLRENVENR